MDLISVISGSAVSLIFSYFPRLKDWFETQTPARKSGVMLIWLLALAAAVLVLDGTALYDVPGIELTFDAQGYRDALRLFFEAAVANQGAFLFTEGFKKSGKAAG